MSSIRKKLLLLSTVLALFSCDQSGSPSEKESEKKSDDQSGAVISKSESRPGVIQEKGGLKLTALAEETSFPDASLRLITKKENLKAGKNRLEFEVDQFELAKQTEDSRSNLLANSKKGQHIHYIYNNGPYQAHYEGTFDAELSEGHNVILAFLSRSYHESVKEPEAFVFEDILIGEEFESFDRTAPCLIYSRPKGTYKLSESDRLLVDFYLLNADLSESGMRIELTVNDLVFMLDHWQPYWIEGLDTGEHKFRLRLLDADGKMVNGPFNDSGIRTIVIE